MIREGKITEKGILTLTLVVMMFGLLAISGVQSGYMIASSDSNLVTGHIIIPPPIGMVLQIDSCSGLQGMDSALSENYRLVKDIDCTGYGDPTTGFSPIGNNTVAFTGRFNGGGNSITGLWINLTNASSTENITGLFGVVDGAIIYDVVLKNVNITGPFHVGGLIGEATDTLIQEVVVIGNVSSNDNNMVGGIVGWAKGTNISQSFFNGNVYSKTGNAGGLVGYLYLYSTINDSVALGTVEAGDNWGGAGGLVGMIEYSAVEDSFTSTIISSASPSNNGALIGNDGGYSSCSDSFWNQDLFDQPSTLCSSGGKSSASLKEESTFSTWDTTNIWYVLDEVAYPGLQWMDEASNITLSSPNNNQIIAGNHTEDFVFQFEDFYNRSYSECQLIIDGNIKETLTVEQNVPTTFSVNPEHGGSDDWTVSCKSPSNETSTESRSAFFDNIPPPTTINYPADGIMVFDPELEFNFSSYDLHSLIAGTVVRCHLFVNGTEVNMTTVFNDTNETMNYTFSSDDLFEWNITCMDAEYNNYTTPSRFLTTDFGPEMPALIDYPSTTTDDPLYIIGYLNMPATINVFCENASHSSSNSSLTESSEALFYESRVIDDLYIDNKSFKISGSDIGNFTVGNYIKFSGHNASNYFYYEIESNISAGPNQYKITLNETFEQDVIVGETVSVYNQSKPTGWFNFSVELLSGMNDLQVWGTNAGTDGPAATFSIGSDNIYPRFNLSELIYPLQANVSASPYFVNFTVSDETLLNISSLNVSISNSSNTLYPIFDCTQIYANIEYECELNVSGIEEGNYTANFSVEDEIGHLNFSEIVNFEIIRTLTINSFQIEDEGATTNSTYIFVNWTDPTPSPLQPGHYELQVYDDYGVNITPWVSVDNETRNHSFTMENYSLIEYGEGYFVRLIPYDGLGNSGDTYTTNGILIEDTSAPEYDFVEIVDDGFEYSRATESFHIRWNYTDNETGISVYEYAIGTEEYPFPGWDDTLSISQTNDSDFVQTGLSLEDNETYFVSVRARNAYNYAEVWTGWRSSTAVTVDRINPVGTAITYQTGSRTVDSINITYNTGVDTISGVYTSSILIDESALSNGVCNVFPGDYSTVEVSGLSAGLSWYLVDNLDSGKCYRFKLVTYDHAGNSAEAFGGTNYNISVDTSDPTAISVIDEGFLTPDTTTYFSWSGGDDPQSGIDRYEYSLGTSPNYNDIFDWTIHEDPSKAVSFTGLPLNDTETYYLCVRAFNNFGGYSESCSNGILYLDMITPDALEVISVNMDGTEPYLDETEGVNWTEITLSGEQDLDCVWSLYDEYYIDVYAFVGSLSTAGNCTETFDGEYHCNVTDLVEGENDVYVMCSDRAGNGQSDLENTDITFMKDLGGPVLEITYPELDGDIVPGVDTNLTVDILDASEIDLRVYQLYSVSNNSLLTTDTFSGSNIPIDLSLYSGEVNLTVIVEDNLSRQSRASRTFIINNDEAYADVENINARNYINGIFYSNTSFNLSAEMYFFNYYNYTITNSSGDIIQNESYSNATKTNHSSLNIFINTSESIYSEDGVYTLRINISDNESAYYYFTRPIIIDRVAPAWINDTCDIAVTPSEICIEDRGLFEPDSGVQAFLIWQDEHGVDKDIAMIEYDIANSTYHKQNLSAVNTSDGMLIYPNSERYSVELDDLLRTNQTVIYTWNVWDLAGNVNSTTKTFFVNNTPPSLLTTGSMMDWGIEDETYTQIIQFVDDDLSQRDYPFDCGVNDSNFSISFNTYGLCVLTNATPLSYGNYSLNITINDTNGTSGYWMDSSLNVSPMPYVEIYNSTLLSLDIDTQTNLNAVLSPGGTSLAEDSGNGIDTLTFLARSDLNQSLVLTLDDFYVQVRAPINLSEQAEFSARKINPTWVSEETDNDTFWEDYTIHSVFGAELNYSDEIFWIGFNLSELGISKTDRMKLFQYEEYNLSEDTINYSSLLSEVSGSSLHELNGVEDDVVYLSSTNFSLFVLATLGELSPVCGNSICESGLGETSSSCPADCSSGGSGGSSSSGGGSSGGGSSGGGSSGGSYYIPTTPLVVANCSDGLRNQDETGIDCGGVCPACIVETAPGASSSEDESDDKEWDILPPQTETDKDNTKPLLPEDVLDNDKNLEESDISESSNAGNFLLWFLIIFVALGAIVLFIAKSRQKHSDALVAGTIEDITGKPDDDDPVHIALYIKSQKGKYADEVIEQFLIEHDYTKENIEAAIAALDDTKRISLVKSYFNHYVKDGFDIEELGQWLVSQGNDATIVAIAKQEFSEEK